MGHKITDRRQALDYMSAEMRRLLSELPEKGEAPHGVLCKGPNAKTAAILARKNMAELVAFSTTTASASAGYYVRTPTGTRRLQRPLETW